MSRIGRPRRSLAKRVREPAHGELRGDVQRAALVRLAACDRADLDDVAAVADVREAEAGHPDQPVDVRLEHDPLVLLRGVPERVAAEGEPRRVDEDVEPAETVHRLGHEALARGRVGDVELEVEIALQELAAPGADAGA